MNFSRIWTSILVLCYLYEDCRTASATMQCGNTRRRYRKRFGQHVPLGRIIYKLLEVDMDTETEELSRRKELKEPNEGRRWVKKNAPSFCVKGGASSVAMLDTCVKIARRTRPQTLLANEPTGAVIGEKFRARPTSFVHQNRFSV